jgi:hypothetical protein
VLFYAGGYDIARIEGVTTFKNVVGTLFADFLF